MNMRLYRLLVIATALLATWSAMAAAPTLYVDDDYSAAGANDGHTWGVDAFATIQAAIDVASAGATIEVAAGTYQEDLLIGTADLTVQGAKAGVAGQHASRGSGNHLDGDAAGESVLTGYENYGPADGRIVISASGVTIDGLFLDVNEGPGGLTEHYQVVAVNAAQATLQNLKVESYATSSQKVEIQIAGSGTGATVANCLISRDNINQVYSGGIELGGPYAAAGPLDANLQNNTLSQTYIDTTSPAAVDAASATWTITGNTITHPATGLAISVKGPGWSALPGAMDLSGIHSNNDDLLVKTTSSSGHRNWHTSIGAAVGAAGDYTDILVPAGTFTETIVIDKPVTLLGAQADVPPLEMDALGRPVGAARTGAESIIADPQITNSGHTIVILADDVTVNGFEITGFYNAIDVRAPANGTRSNLTVSHCYLHSDRAWTSIVFGSDLDGSLPSTGTGTFDNMQVINTRIEPSNASKTPHSCISLTNLFTTVAFDNFLLSGLYISNPGAHGIFAGANPTSFTMQSPDIRDSVFEGNSRGMNVYNMIDATITNNLFIGNTALGAVINTRQGVVSDNDFLQNGYGLLLWGDKYGPVGSYDTTVSGNTFLYNTMDEPASIANGLAILTGSDAGSMTITANTFINGGCRDGALALLNEGTGSPDASGNWWDTIDSDEIDAAIDGDYSASNWWLAPPADLFVDDDWAGTPADTVMSVSQVIELSDGTTYTHNASPVFGTTAFATLQDALDAALPAETIYVAAGDYGSGDTTWTVNQAQSIIGVQVGIDPTDSLNGRGLADTSGEANLSGAFIVDADVCRVLFGGLSMVYDSAITTVGETTSIALGDNAGAVTVYHSLLADPTLDSGLTPPWGTHLGISSSSVGLNGLTVRQNLITGYTTAIDLNPNANDVVLDGNLIDDSELGIVANGTTNLVITDNAIEADSGLQLRTSTESSGTSGDPSTGVVLTDNAFTQHADAFSWYIQLQDGEINTIGTLDASDNSFAGVAVSAMNTTQYSTLQANVVDRNDDASYGLLAFLQDPATLVLDDANGEPGDVLTITATLTSGGNPVSGKSILFKLDGSSIGSGTTNTSGVATFNLLIDFGAGDYDLAASFSGDGSHQGAADTATLSITGYGTPTSLTITPATASITADASQAFTAEASDGLASWDVTAETDWTITAGAGGSFTANTYDAENTGSFTVYGTYDGLIASAALTVTHGAAVSLAITPATETVDSGDTVTYTATATDADGNTWDASASAVFSDNGADGSFAANVYTAATPATVTISAGLGALTSNTATLTVNAGAAYIGNVLRFNVDNQAFKLGTLDVTADGWYDLGVPSGAQVYIDVTLASRSASATITQYDEDGDGDGHGDAVGVLANSLSCSFYYRYGTPYRLLQTSTVGGTSISGTYYSSYNKTSITGVGYVNGIQLLTNTFITTSNIQQSYTAAP